MGNLYSYFLMHHVEQLPRICYCLGTGLQVSRILPRTFSHKKGIYCFHCKFILYTKTNSILMNNTKTYYKINMLPFVCLKIHKLINGKRSSKWSWFWKYLNSSWDGTQPKKYILKKLLSLISRRRKQCMVNDYMMKMSRAKL